MIYFKKRGMKKRSKEKLTRKFLVGLGIPMVFVPGLILAAVLGWDWEKDLRWSRRFWMGTLSSLRVDGQ